MTKYIQLTIAIATLTSGYLVSENDAIPKTKVFISKSNVNLKKETKMFTITNLYSNILQGIAIIGKKTDNPVFSYNYLQLLHKTSSSKWEAIENIYFDVNERVELNITSNGNWDLVPRHTAKNVNANVKPGNLSLHKNKNQNIQRNDKRIQPQMYNVSSVLDTARNYHKLIGIPLAKKMRQNKNYYKLKCKIRGNTYKECRARIAGASYTVIRDFPFVVSIIYRPANPELDYCTI